MNKLLYYMRYYKKNPKEFYPALKSLISSYILKFKGYKYNDSIKTLIKNWNSFLYLNKEYNSYLEQLPNYNESDKKENIIWWCWLQGEENAPKLNKKCLASIRKHIKNKKIIVLTDKNIKDYIEFPNYIIKKYKDGIITRTHFSDLLRCELLIKYGGTWIDSSVLLTSYEKIFFDSNFFVFNNFHRGDESIALSSWFITSNKNNPILLTTRDLLYEYWKHNNFLINYFLFHMFFTMATKKYPEIRQNVPKYSNIPPHIMQYEFLEKYNEERFEELKKISSIHKLNHKIDRKKLSKNSLFEYIENM